MIEQARSRFARKRVTLAVKGLYDRDVVSKDELNLIAGTIASVADLASPYENRSSLQMLTRSIIASH